MKEGRYTRVVGFRSEHHCNAASPLCPCPASRRRAAVRRFASDASVRVALLSVTAAGVGLDFSSASVVVFAGG